MTSVTLMPELPALLDGLARRGLRVEERDGQLVLVGCLDRIDEVVAVVVRWHADNLRIVVAGRRTGHAVGVCNQCGHWSMIRCGESPSCRMTPGCKGRHHEQQPAPRRDASPS